MKKWMREHKMSLFVITAAIVMLLGLSYAWLQITLRGEREINIFAAGSLKLVLDDTMTNGINITEAVPVTDDEGKTLEEYTFTLENTGKVDSDYTIYFRPNDGYREIAYNKNNMSTDLEPLNIASSQGYFTLTDKMMSVSDTLYNQAWYGEFKLPNTTIAVKKGDSIRNALQDGYLAVKFDIQCLDFDESGSATVSYNQNDKSLIQQENTTQWDYEGYLGFSMLGQKLTENNSLRLQLEKGIWKISTDEEYKFVKGTVVLYDLDHRASSDFE